MKNKGFTLIELLAVIVILAVITIIAVPKILDVIENARRSAFESSVKLIEDSIKKQISINGIIKNNNIIIKNVYADENIVFEKDAEGNYLFDFTTKNSNYTKLKVNNKEKFTGTLLYRNDKKFIYTEFTDGRYILNTDENGNKTITGGIIKKKYTITFMNETEEYTKIEVEENNKVTKPETDPTKPDYIFKYWSLTDGGSEYNFDTTITENLTLHAVYQSDLTSCAANNITVGSGIVCKRATSLHTEECGYTSDNYCYGAGYYTSGSKGTNQIVYGNCGTRGTLTSGDAFDCDVTGNGNWERFYYVTSNGNNAVLIYYNNTSPDGVNKVKSDNTTTSLIAYDLSNENWHGPRTAISNLPSTSQWSNNKIIVPGTRQITYEDGNTSTTVSGTTYTIQSFTYTNKAARLLTYQEVKSACGNGTVTSTGYLDNCNYLMENTKYSSDSMGTYGYWLETPRSSDARNVWDVFGNNRYVPNIGATTASHAGVRPVIEVLKSDMNY